MKKIALLYLIFGLTLLMASCGQSLEDSDVEYEAIKSELNVSESSISLDGSGQTISVQISCNSYWYADTKSNWIYLNTYSGKGNGTMSVRVYANTSTTAEREDKISVTDGINTVTVSISQGPTPEKLTLSESNLSFGYNGGTSYVYVESNGSWSATSDADWCVLSTTSSRITVKASSNNSYTSRTATITVKGSATSSTLKVNQAAPKEPTIGELIVSNITKTSADCQFTYSSADLSLQSRGICYSTSNQNPTTSNECLDYYTSIKSGTASFNLSGLSQNTTYYVRPYVVTAVGTTYGQAVQFKTIKSNSPGEGDNPPPSY